VKKIRRVSFVIAVLTGVVIAASQTTPGQICAGSSLRYVVRDAKGVVIDPSKAFTPDKYSRIEELKDAAKVLKGAAEPVRIIQWHRMCNFPEPVRATLKLNGREMMLEFLMPQLSEYDSRSFLVDSIPFHAGHYVIDLSGDGEETAPGPWLGQFYAAKNWSKMTSAKH
jgi:hypothetical protein